MYLTQNNKGAIGIVGGMGPYAGLDLLKKTYDWVDAKKDQDYPDIYMVSTSRLIPDRSYYIKNPDTENPCIGICHCIKQLSELGATHIGIPCNTAHSPIILNQVKAYLQIEGIHVKIVHIVEETYKWACQNIKEKRIVLFATEGTYCSRVYHKIFEAEGRFEIVEPACEDKPKIWDAIYSPEYGIKTYSSPVKDQAVENFRLVVEKMMQTENVHTFIMGCTEIPLAMGRLRLPITKIDPGNLLARALIGTVFPEKLKIK